MKVVKKIFSKKNILKSIGLLIFLYIIIFKVNLNELYQTIKSINTGYLVFLLVIYLFSTIIQPLRWQYILKKIGIKINFIQSYYMTFVSVLIGLATPAKIGEIGTRVSFFVKDKNLIRQSLTAVILERIIDVIFLFVFASLSILFFINLLPFEFQILAIAILLIFLIIMLLVIRGKLSIIIKKIFLYIIPAKYKKIYYHLGEIYADLKTIDWQAYLTIIFLTLFCWLSTFFITYIFVISLGLDIPFIYFCMASAVACLTSLIPISISGIGLRETAYIILLSPFNVSLEKIVAFSLASMLTIMFLLALTGLICLCLSGITRINTRNDAEISRNS